MRLSDYPDLEKLTPEQKQELIDELKKTAIPRRRFIFGVDLDGVVMDFYGALKPIAAEYLGRPVAELTNEYRYGLKEWGLLDKKGGYDLSYPALHRYAVNQHEIFRTAPPIEGAPFQLRRLSRLGVHIRIITHRLFVGGLHGKAVTQTAAWLEKHDIPYKDLCFVADKTSINANLYIDDSPENIEAFAQKGMPCIVFENPTNRHIPGPLRASTWEEVYALVETAMKADTLPAIGNSGAP